MILFCTIYLIVIELIQALTVPFKTYIKSLSNMNNVFMHILNMIIVLSHANRWLDSLNLAVISSLSCLHLWWNLFQWMRVLPSTSIYVMLIS